MDKLAFIAAGERLYGKFGWKTQLADNLGMHRVTIQRYASGKMPIPGRVVLAMQALETSR